MKSAFSKSKPTETTQSPVASGSRAPSRAEQQLQPKTNQTTDGRAQSRPEPQPQPTSTSALQNLERTEKNKTPHPLQHSSTLNSKVTATPVNHPQQQTQALQRHFGPEDADSQGNWVSRWKADADYIRGLSDDMLLSFMAEHARQNSFQQRLLNQSQLQSAANSNVNSPLQQLPSHLQQREIVDTLQNLETSQQQAVPGSSKSNAAREFSSILENNLTSQANQTTNVQAKSLPTQPQPKPVDNEAQPSPQSKRRKLIRPDLNLGPKTQDQVAIRSSTREKRQPDRLQVSEIEEESMTPLDQV